MTRQAEWGLLSAIIVYPIKSAAGIRLPEARLEAPGLEFDRRWMVVDHNHSFLTQRQLPKMALIKPEVKEELLLVDAPGMRQLRLPKEPDRKIFQTVRVWEDRCPALPMGNEAAEWFSAFLGVTCSLVYLPETVRRGVDPTYAKSTDRVGFADGFPLLLTSEASLADLNARLEQALPMSRFRPNLVVRGLEAFAEDFFSELWIGDLSFRIVKPCARCSITTVDQATAEVGKEPLRTLARYRRVVGKVMFGQNLIHNGLGTIRVADRAFFREA